MASPHPSDSAVQRAAEGLVLAELSRLEGLSIRGRTYRLSGGSTVQIDGATEGWDVLCEIYAHVGPLKGGQPHKLAADILKLILVAQDLGATRDVEPRLVVGVLGSNAFRLLTSDRAWLAAAVKQFGIEVRLVDLPDAVANVAEAQRLQFR